MRPRRTRAIFKIQYQDSTKSMVAKPDAIVSDIISSAHRKSGYPDTSGYGLLIKMPTFSRPLNDFDQIFELAPSLNSRQAKSFIEYTKELLNISIKIGDISVSVSTSSTISDVESAFSSKGLDGTLLLNGNPISNGNVLEVLKIVTEKDLFSLKLSASIPEFMKPFFNRIKQIEIFYEPFEQFNRRIMDIVVDANEIFLKSSGFNIDVAGNIEQAGENMELLNSIKKQLDDSSSKFSNYVEVSQTVIGNLIENYLNIAVKTLVQENGLSSTNYQELVNEILNLNAELHSDLIREVKNLQSLLQIRSEGVSELIKQDLGVYFFNTKNDLEMFTTDPTTSSAGFLTPYIRRGFLEVKKGLLARRQLSFSVMTPRFFHLFLKPNTTDGDVSDIVRSSSKHISYPLSSIKVNRGDEYEFNIEYNKKSWSILAQSTSECEEWINLITLMQRKIQGKMSISVHKVNSATKFEYNIKFIYQDNNPIFVVSAFNEEWKIEKDFNKIIELSNNISKVYQNIILPSFPETKLFDEYGISYCQAFFHEALMNLHVNQNSLTLEFFLINDIVRAVLSNNIEQVKYLVSINPECVKVNNLINQCENIEILNILLQAGADVNSRDKIGRGLIHKAIVNSDPNLFQLFIKYKGNVNIRDTSGITAVIESVKRNLAKFLQVLIVANADVNMKEISKGDTAINLAIRKGYTDIVKILINKADLTITNNDQRNPLHIAIESESSIEIINLIIEKINPNIQDVIGKTALHIATSRNEEYVKILLEHGADPNIQDEVGKTPLHYAIQENFKNLELFLSKGANPNIPDNVYKLSPFHFALSLDKPEIVQTMMNCKIDTTLIDNKGDKMIHTAIRKRDFSSLKLLLYVFQADPNVPTIEGLPPLHLACQMGAQELVEVLISAGAKVDGDDSQGQKPAHVSALVDSIQCLESLSNNGADMFDVNSEGNTPLHIAASNGNESSVRFLSQKGDVNTQNLKGETPLHLASHKNQISCAVILAESGGFLSVLNNSGQTPIDVAKSNKIKRLVKEAATRFSQPQIKPTIVQEPKPQSRKRELSKQFGMLLRTLEQKTADEGKAKWIQIIYHGPISIGIRIPTKEYSIKEIFDLGIKNIGFTEKIENLVFIGEDDICRLSKITDSIHSNMHRIHIYPGNKHEIIL